MNYDWEQIKYRADGQWQSILSSIAGLSDRELSNKHQPCPACGGNDRYRFDDKQGSGSYICSQCGAGDGLSLLIKVTGMQFVDAITAVARYLNIDPSDQNYKPVKREVRKRIVSTRKNDFFDKEAANAVIAGSLEIRKTTPWAIRNRIKQPMIVLKNNESVLFSIERTMEIVNILEVSKDNKKYSYLANGMTNGGYHIINNNEGKSIFFCVNIIDSHLTAQFTNCECVCVFEFANMQDAIEQYIEDYKPEKPLYISSNYSEVELCIAEKADLRVILPFDSDDIQTSSGFHKKLFNATEVLNSEQL